MMDLLKRLSTLHNDRDRGASAAEYALIMGFIVAALITILAVFGPAIANNFDSACTKLTGSSCL